MATATRDIWTRRVHQWATSGLTARDFAHQSGINPNTLTHWKWKLGSEARKPNRPERPGVGFVELLNAAAAAPPMESERLELILLSGLKVLVPAGFDGAVLRRLLDTLEIH